MAWYWWALLVLAVAVFGWGIGMALYWVIIKRLGQ